MEINKTSLQTIINTDYFVILEIDGSNSTALYDMNNQEDVWRLQEKTNYLISANKFYKLHVYKKEGR